MKLCKNNEKPATKKESIRITKTNTGLSTDYHYDSHSLSIPANTDIFITERLYCINYKQ